MTIDLSPETEARLKANAQAEGVSVGAYVERLIFEQDTCGIRVAEFEQAIGERLRSLDRGETVDGEEVMNRLVSELDESRQVL